MIGTYYGYDDPQAAANGLGEYFQTSGLGAYFTQQPPTLPMRGVGEVYYDDSTVDAGTAATLGMLWIAMRAAGGFVAGRAMAPTAGERNTWGTVGALLGTLGGPAALGLIGLLALQSKSTA